MTENLNPNDPNEVKYPAPAPEAEEMALDDARRVGAAGELAGFGDRTCPAET